MLTFKLVELTSKVQKQPVFQKKRAACDKGSRQGLKIVLAISISKFRLLFCSRRARSSLTEIAMRKVRKTPIEAKGKISVLVIFCVNKVVLELFLRPKIGLNWAKNSLVLDEHLSLIIKVFLDATMEP